MLSAIEGTVTGNKTHQEGQCGMGRCRDFEFEAQIVVRMERWRE